MAVAAAAMAQLRFSPLPAHYHAAPSFPSPRHLHNPSLYLIKPNHFPQRLHGSGGIGRGGGDNGGGDSGNWGHDGDLNDYSDGCGVLGLLLSGWKSRVAADPQFPFKVLMEELVGVSACVLGDMATRPNFGLNELDFVFSTLVVGCILNFTLMYLLAPVYGKF